MNRAKEAKQRFEDGFLCAPAVFSAYSELFGLEKATALKIACGFGAGMARMGVTCGAVTGAMMVIGLKYGRTDLADEESQQRTYVLVQEFIAKFKVLHGCIECKELIGYDLGKLRELRLARESGIFVTKCPSLVHDAARILEDILEL